MNKNLNHTSKKENGQKEVKLMKKAMMALGLVVVMLLGVSYVFAQEQGDPPRHGWMHGEKSWDQGKRLNLTPEQKEKFQGLRRKFIGENAQLIGGLVAKRLELRSLWTDPKADSQAILAKEKELRDLQNRMRDKIIQYKLEARNSLTPEQIEKIGMMGWKGFGHGFGMGHGQGMGHSGTWQ
jgi:Spy/CpxP family protein refolding chaperone